MQQHSYKWMSLVVALLVSTTLAFSQSKENDPYSIIGLGNIDNLNFAGLSAMPGLTSTYHDPYAINIQNPAASSFLGQTAFEVGGYYKRNAMKSPLKTEVVHTGNLRYFGLGFPLFNSLNKLNERKKKPYALGMTFSLTPYSSVGYNLLQRDSSNTRIGLIESDFKGKGGTYKFLWGNSFRYKGLAIGLNIGYLFGKQTAEHWDKFRNQASAYSNHKIAESSIYGFVWNVGALYEYALPQKVELDSRGKEIRRPRTRITLGVHGNSKNKVNISSTTSSFNEFLVLNDLTLYQDTISYSENKKGKITLPSEFGMGLMISKDLNWKIGVDYTLSNWSEYVNDNNPNNLNNSFKIAFGAEWTPKWDAPFRKYGKRITYRIGGIYEKDPRRIDGLDAWTKKAFTFGFKFPLQPDLDNRKLVSSVSLSSEIGKYGNSAYIEQTYFKINIGFTLNDNLWFFKSKYN